MTSKIFRLTFFFITAVFLAVPLACAAQQVTFNIEPYYDLYDRQEVSAQLIKTTDFLHFYADESWWQDLTSSEKRNLRLKFDNLANEFADKIYPGLTSLFGAEPEHGINKDEKTTVLLHPMVSEAGGYFNSGDLYDRFQNPKSNERKMVYLNSRHINKPEANYYLAHEFMHLITANQKDLQRGVTEEIWLNEARSEYTATLLGYNDIYGGSNLEKRVVSFLSNPRISLTEWLNRKEDYGIINLFTTYLVDHYGIEVLVDSLQSRYVGIESINYALEKNNYRKDFSDVFADWLITLLVNDCDIGERYCYLTEHLEDFRITPALYHLPRSGSIISSHQTTYWAGNWHRFIGGSNYFTFGFEGPRDTSFKIPYVVCDLTNSCFVSFVSMNEDQKGEIYLSDFAAKYGSLTIMPFIYNKTSGFNGREPVFTFSWEATVAEMTEEEKEAALIERLEARIAEIKKLIAEYRAKITALLAERGQISCQRIDNNLSLGMRDSAEVRCLQEFLRAQGPEIYPEGLITGNFLSLTQAAVIRFQEQHADEILKPFGLEKGTGYVGPATRDKINQVLGQLP